MAKKQADDERKKRRQRAEPWKRVYGTDRGYTRRKDAADDRAIERSVRSAEDQIAILDERLGVGVGATKERARLASN